MRAPPRFTDAPAPERGPARHGRNADRSGPSCSTWNKPASLRRLEPSDDPRAPAPRAAGAALAGVALAGVRLVGIALAGVAGALAAYASETRGKQSSRTMGMRRRRYRPNAPVSASPGALVGLAARRAGMCGRRPDIGRERDLLWLWRDVSRGTCIGRREPWSKTLAPNPGQGGRQRYLP